MRAKARFDRWDEEMKFVRHEMTWCVLYFRKQKEIWMRWTNLGGDGHQAYIYKQAAIWERFEVEGLVWFSGKMVA